ncbi:hypothetical protein [Hoeflea sp.]|uniref:hypothetical protein n=1 Tax=Hoeflea sp. TaxID=1940281 RepID=UPI0019B369A7|nr:hypothetical protein [Hoeflea sp.]MBC7282852.1 hypothetical protein [Hoeflea sp.]
MIIAGFSLSGCVLQTHVGISRIRVNVRSDRAGCGAYNRVTASDRVTQISHDSRA